MWKFGGIVLNCTVGVINIALFWLWMSLIRIEADRPSEDRAYVLDNVAFSLSVLEVLVAFVAILFAVLGLLGFAEIRKNAEQKASETAERVADKIAQEAARQFNAEMKERWGLPSEPSIRPEVATTAGAVREGDGE